MAAYKADDRVNSSLDMYTVIAMILCGLVTMEFICVTTKY